MSLAIKSKKSLTLGNKEKKSCWFSMSAPARARLALSASITVVLASLWAVFFDAKFILVIPFLPCAVLHLISKALMYYKLKATAIIAIILNSLFAVASVLAIILSILLNFHISVIIVVGIFGISTLAVAIPNIVRYIKDKKGANEKENTK